MTDELTSWLAWASPTNDVNSSNRRTWNMQCKQTVKSYDSRLQVISTIYMSKNVFNFCTSSSGIAHSTELAKKDILLLNFVSFLYVLRFLVVFYLRLGFACDTTLFSQHFGGYQMEDFFQSVACSSLLTCWIIYLCCYLYMQRGENYRNTKINIITVATTIIFYLFALFHVPSALTIMIS